MDEKIAREICYTLLDEARMEDRYFDPKKYRWIFGLNIWHIFRNHYICQPSFVDTNTAIVEKNADEAVITRFMGIDVWRDGGAYDENYISLVKMIDNGEWKRWRHNYV